MVYKGGDVDFLRPPLPSTKPAVFGRCFDVVALLTKRLPIATIPKQLFVTSMRNYVIYYCCQLDFATRLMLDAKRMRT